MSIRIILAALAAACASAPASAANELPPGISAERILEATDRVRGGGVDGLQWHLKITATDSDTGSDVREVNVKASGDDSLAETTFPPRAAGGRLLQVGRNMWYGRPDLQKPVSISSRQKMLGPAANGDIASTNYLKDYDAQLVRIVEVDGEPAYMLNLVGKTKWVTYDRIEYWVSQKRLVPLKAAFYTVSGKLFKTAVFETDNVVQLGGQRQVFVSRMTIRDAINTDSVSVLDYSQIKLVGLSRYDLSVEALTR